MQENQKLDILKLRLEGESSQRIAKRMGLTLADVNGALTEIRKMLKGASRKRSNLADICVFPALREYIQDNEINRKELYDMVRNLPGIQKCPASYASYINTRLMGKRPFTSAEWIRLAKVTGIPLERLMDSEGNVTLGREQGKCGR